MNPNLRQSLLFLTKLRQKYIEQGKKENDLDAKVFCNRAKKRVDETKKLLLLMQFQHDDYLRTGDFELPVIPSQQAG